MNKVYSPSVQDLSDEITRKVLKLRFSEIVDALIYNKMIHSVNLKEISVSLDNETTEGSFISSLVVPAISRKIFHSPVMKGDNLLLTIDFPKNESSEYLTTAFVDLFPKILFMKKYAEEISISKNTVGDRNGVSFEMSEDFMVNENAGELCIRYLEDATNKVFDFLESSFSRVIKDEKFMSDLVAAYLKNKIFLSDLISKTNNGVIIQ